MYVDAAMAALDGRSAYRTVRPPPVAVSLILVCWSQPKITAPGRSIPARAAGLAGPPVWARPHPGWWP